jgi:hypothetical protein
MGEVRSFGLAFGSHLRMREVEVEATEYGGYLRPLS